MVIWSLLVRTLRRDLSISVGSWNIMSRCAYFVGRPAVRPLVKLPVHVFFLHLWVMVSQSRDHKSIYGGGVLLLVSLHISIIHSSVMLTHQSIVLPPLFVCFYLRVEWQSILFSNLLSRSQLLLLLFVLMLKKEFCLFSIISFSQFLNILCLFLFSHLKS